MYSIAWNGTLSNADMGDNIEDIMSSDCFALSNPIDINRVDCPGIIDDEADFFTNEITTAPLNNDIKLYPVPTSTMLNVEYTSVNDENIYMHVLDANGQALKVQLQNVLKGENTYQVDVIDLPGGIYYLKVFDTKGNMQVKPFTKITP